MQPGDAVADVDRHRGTGPAEDYLTCSGAYVLAESVRHYWHERGSKKLNVWVEPINKADPDTGYQVRSNLRNGLPPDLTAADLIQKHNLTT
jgi:hypothetical protein